MLKCTFSNGKVRIFDIEEINKILSIAGYTNIKEFIRKESKYFNCKFEII